MSAGRGVAADLAEVAAAGRAMEQAADRVDRIDLVPELPAVAEALPGSRAAQAVETLLSAWTCGFDRWALAARRHAQALQTGAVDYATTEAEVRRALGSRTPPPPTPGPPARQGLR